MNFFSGVIIGILVAIGIAYVHDASISGSDREARAIVNWDAFNAEVRGTSESLSSAWNRLTGSMPRREESR